MIDPYGVAKRARCPECRTAAQTRCHNMAADPGRFKLLPRPHRGRLQRATSSKNRACTACGAKAGKDCRTATGQRCPPHKARRRTVTA